MKLSEKSRYYHHIEKGLIFIKENYNNEISSKEIAEYLSLSEPNFQSTFKHWAGISPKKFIQSLSKQRTLEVLAKSRYVMATGKNHLSNPTFDLEIESYNEYINSGKEMDISYGIFETIFGKCLIGITKRGICHLSFIYKNRSENLEHLKNKWKTAKLVKNQSETSAVIDKVFSPKNNRKKPIKLFLKGTDFQLKVWKALTNIPPGSLLSYEDIAKKIKKPKAVRAVSNAIANNPVAYLIPCHRVVRKAGLTHNYRWGTGRKMAMIGFEQAKYSLKN